MARNRNRNNSGSILGSLTLIVLAFIAFCGYLVYIGKWWVVLIIITVMIIVAGGGIFFFFNEKTTPQSGTTAGGTVTPVRTQPSTPAWYDELLKGVGTMAGVLMFVLVVIAIIFIVKYFGGAIPLIKSGFTGKDVQVINAESAREEFVADSTRKAKENLKRLRIQEQEETKRHNTAEKEATRRLKEQLKHERDLERLKKQEAQQNSNTRTDNKQDEYSNYKFKDNSSYQEPQDYWYPPDMPPQGPLYQ